MAAKQYEMLFALGARLNSTFQGTFSSAQKVLNATQKEIQNLNRVQSDIGSYQRQQAGLEKSKNQLELYKKQLEITQNALRQLNSEENKDVEAIARLESKEQELCNKIQNTETAITDKTKRLDDMRQKLSDAGVKTDQLAQESERFKAEMKQLAEDEEKAADEAAKFGEAGAHSAEAVASALAAAGIVTALNKIYDAYKECVGISMEFESTMSTVEALSGANALEMQALSEQARELGATTAFTANQSAKAMTYMGMAGWSASEMMSGMDGVISLAAASGEDLAMVSDIVTDNLTAFGLTADDTAHFADVLAQAASKSNTSVAIMGETFKGSASVAGALGYTIEDVAVAVGLMANSGVKGSIANTALKNTFNGLLNGATLSAKAFGDIEYTTVNADGTMKGFGETIDELRVYFDQMTEAERVNNAMAIAGQRGYNGLLAILNATDTDYQSLKNSINDCSGAAERMADIKLDNLKGDVTLLDSAAEGLKNTVGGLYNDDLRGLAQLGTQILSGVNSFVEKNPALTKGIMTVGAGVGLVVAEYTALAAAKKVKNALDVVGNALKLKSAAASATLAAAEGGQAAATAGATGATVGLNTAMLANPAVIVTTAIVALTAAFVHFNAENEKTALETQTLTTATEEQIAETKRLTYEYGRACDAYGETDDRALALKYDLDNATAAIKAQSFSVKELYSEIDTLYDSTTELLSDMNSSTIKIDEQQDSAMILSAKLRELASSADSSAVSQGRIEPIIERLNEMYPSLGLTVENVSGKLDGLNDQIERAANVDSLKAKYDAAQKSLDDLYIKQGEAQNMLAEAEAAEAKARENVAGKIKEDPVPYMFGLFGLAKMISDYNSVKGDWDTASEELQKEYDAIAMIEQQIEDSNAAVEEYEAIVSGTSDEMVGAYDAVVIAVSGVTEQTQSLLQAYNDAYQAAYESVSGQYNLWTMAEKIIPTSIDTINNALTSQQSYWDDYSANLDVLQQKAKDIEGLGDVVASFVDGSKESVNAVAGMAAAAKSGSDDQLKDMVDNYQKAREAERKVAEELAETKTNFEKGLDDVNSALAETVESMKMETEAEEAAKRTMDAYIQAIRDSAGGAGEAAAMVKAATDAALGNVLIAEATPGGEALRGFRAIEYGQYASGTDYAAAGLALVGEQGPEFIQMRGGEKVYNAVETKAMLGGRNTHVVISPSFTISGDVGENTESKLKEFAGQLVEMVKDALDEAGIDKKRSEYA